MWITLSSDGRPGSEAVEVGAGTWVVGRGAGCDVVVADPAVSARHAQLDVSGTGVWLTDLGSTNGTFVAGDRLLAPASLAMPADFRVGATTVRLSVDAPTTLMAGPVRARPPAESRPRATTPSPAPPAPPPTPPPWPVAPPPAPNLVRDAGAVAGRDMSLRAGRDLAGRDIIHEGFKLQTRMRSSAKNLVRLGCVVFLVGFALVGYFVIAWNNEIFDAIGDPSAEPPSDLPSPLPWLPVGFGLSFLGLVLVVAGLLVPRDRVMTPQRRR